MYWYTEVNLSLQLIVFSSQPRMFPVICINFYFSFHEFKFNKLNPHPEFCWNSYAQGTWGSTLPTCGWKYWRFHLSERYKVTKLQSQGSKSLSSQLEVYDIWAQLSGIQWSKCSPVFVILLSIFALTPTPICAYFRSLPRLSGPIRAYSCLFALTPTHADAQISRGEWQKPAALMIIISNFVSDQQKQL